MVRLIGEVAALKGGHAEKKRFVMEGLCRLIDADAWVWGLSCQREPDKPQVYVSMLKSGFTEEGFVKLLRAVEHPEMIEITAPFFHEMKQKKTHLTRLRHQISDESLYEHTEAFALWREADIGSLMLSQRPIDETSSSTIGIYRRLARPKFSTRESRIAHIILTEIPWLHEQGWPEDRGVSVPALSTRQRLALNLLTHGQSHKQIAMHMGISLHTLHGYVKNIYRHFGVRSQAELMNRFFQGNGHDGVS